VPILARGAGSSGSQAGPQRRFVVEVVERLVHRQQIFGSRRDKHMCLGFTEKADQPEPFKKLLRCLVTWLVTFGPLILMALDQG
jgi:hypothetical protein